MPPVMSYKGTVKNGVVVLEAGAILPDGTAVTVEAEARPSAAELKPTPGSPEDDPLFDMSKYAVDTGIPDLAVNLDHYLYGHPKVTDAR
jgi:hypothetical protein